MKVLLYPAKVQKDSNATTDIVKEVMGRAFLGINSKKGPDNVNIDENPWKRKSKTEHEQGIRDLNKEALKKCQIFNTDKQPQYQKKGDGITCANAYDEDILSRLNESIRY